MRYFLFSVLIDVTPKNVWDISMTLFDIYNNKGKETGKERKQKDATKTIMHSCSRPNHE